MKKIISIALALLMVAVMLPVMAMAADNVAKIGETEYPTLEAAFAAVKNNETIEVMKDCSGNGIVVQSGKNFTVNFNNCTYNIDGTTVGSTGTETNGFQLLKDSTITFMNGKLTSTKAKILIQNYCNLTLKNMVLDGSNLNRSNPNYTLSNNNGNVVIDGTKISAADGMVAFDVCRYADYVGPKVTVKGNSVINGKVEISSSSAKDGAQHELVIENGTFNGPIVKDGDSPNFSSSISGGTFNTDVTPYVHNELVVTYGNNYYVGNDAAEIIESAQSGTITVENVGNNTSFTVKPGVTVQNNWTDNITVNGERVNSQATYTVPGAPIIIYTPTEDTPKADNQKNPSTGANDFVGVAAAMAVVSLLGAAAVIRKK